MASNLIKRTLTELAMIAAIGLGTFKGTSGIPFVYNVRNENGYGIQVGLVNENHADFSGIQLGIANFNSKDGVVNGISLAGINVGDYGGVLRGVEVGLANTTQRGSWGLGLGIANVVMEGTDRIHSWNPIFNVMNGYQPAQYSETNTVSGVKN